MPRSRINEMIKKVSDALLDNEYQTARQLAKKCHLSPTSIYKIIRMMRLGNIGVLTTPKGYVLSKYANKKDDVHFLRRCYGRRTADYIALVAAEPDINYRWRSIEEKKELKMIVGPLSVDLRNSKGMQVLLSKETNGQDLSHEKLSSDIS